MPTVCDIFKQYAEPFLKTYGHSLSNEQKKAVLDISACGTGRLGISIYKCNDCGNFHQVNNSCGNRHCPGCQNHKTGEWIENQLTNLLPVDYFFGTFTIPSELYPLALSQPRQLYDAIFQASADALKTLAYDGKYIGGNSGFTGILHTWKQNKRLHPHIHYIIPGGGLTEDGFEWISTTHRYFVNVNALMIIYRAKLLEILDKKGLCNPSLCRKLKNKKWNVYMDHAGNGKNVVKYMANYVFRVAITDNNIVAVEDDKVTFQYKKRDTKQYVQETIGVFKFMTLFLLHILPSGYLKVRNFGFLSNRKRADSVAQIRELLNKHMIETQIALEIDEIRKKRKQAEIRCPQCNGEFSFYQMQYVSVRFHPLYSLAWKKRNPP